MVENIKRINNPLTIIAIFAALAEVSATVAIGLIDKSLHHIFIWFIIGFPSLLVVLFFLTLNFNTKVMYSPSDYKDDKSFMDSIFGGYYGNKKNEETDNFINEKITQELENKILGNIQPKLEKLQQENNIEELKKEIAIIKDELRVATDQSAKELTSLSLLSPDLKNKMLNLYRFPANFLPLYAILKTKAENIEVAKEFSKNFFIPGTWEKNGITRLLKEGLLIGDIDNFKIDPTFEKELVYWIERNDLILREISTVYKRMESETKTKESVQKTIDESRIVAEALRF
jgi:hypothetical protein